VRCGVLIRSPNECIIGGARAAPTKVRDWFRHESIGAEWQRSGGLEEFSAARRRRCWIVREQLRNDPLKESAGTCECAAKDHPVAERYWSGSCPEATRECSRDARCLHGSCRNGDAARGATHIDAEPRIGEARANNGGEAIVHPCCDWNASRESEICSWPREQGADSGAREHFGRECALIKACGEQGAALRRRDASCRIPEGADRLAREPQRERIPRREEPGGCGGSFGTLANEPSRLR
jgi:hypothetical protein